MRNELGCFDHIILLVACIVYSIFGVDRTLESHLSHVMEHVDSLQRIGEKAPAYLDGEFSLKLNISLSNHSPNQE